MLKRAIFIRLLFFQKSALFAILDNIQTGPIIWHLHQHCDELTLAECCSGSANDQAIFYSPNLGAPLNGSRYPLQAFRSRLGGKYNESVRDGFNRFTEERQRSQRRKIPPSTFYWYRMHPNLGFSGRTEIVENGDEGSNALPQY